MHQPVRKQADIKSELAGLHVHGFLFAREQIEQQGGESQIVQRARDELIARAMPAAAAAVREEDQSLRAVGHSEIATERRPPSGNFRFRVHRSLRAIFQVRASLGARAVHATEHLAVLLHAVSHDPASAMRARRRDCVDRAFEAVEDVASSAGDYLEALVIVVSADFAFRHNVIVSRATGTLAVSMITLPFQPGRASIFHR